MPWKARIWGFRLGGAPQMYTPSHTRAHKHCIWQIKLTPNKFHLFIFSRNKRFVIIGHTHTHTHTHVSIWMCCGRAVEA